MECPFCRHKKTEIYNSRQSSGRSYVWRRRRCKNCHNPFTTHEAADLGFLTIAKRDGAQEPYIRLKLIFSIYQACGYDEAYLETIETLANTIEGDILDLQKSTIATGEVADAILTVLKRYDPSMFMRYLSHRNDFTSMQQLKQQLQEL